MKNMYLDLEQVRDDEMYLFMGGLIMEGCYYREKDVLEDDFSDPSLSGQYEIEELSKMDDMYKVVLIDKSSRINFALTESELAILLTDGNGKRIFDKIKDTIKQGD